MNEEELKRLIDIYLPMILAEDGKDSERFAVMLAREINREVRFRALAIVNEMSERIRVMNNIETEDRP